MHDEILVILLELLCELNCCQIKKEIYMCTIYTRLNTCLIIIHRFALRDKVTLLALYFHIADAAEWFRVLDIRLSDRYCCVSKVWVLIPSWVEQTICQLKNLIQALCNWLKYIYTQWPFFIMTFAYQYYIRFAWIEFEIPLVAKSAVIINVPANRFLISPEGQYHLQTIDS